MNLKKMIAVCAALAVTVVTASAQDKKQPTGMEDRQVWVNTLVKIADPVLSNLANNTLRENMPQESLDTKRVHRFSHLEAVGRTLCGIAPWLELGLPANGSVLDGAFHSLDGPEGMERRGRDGRPCDR